MKRWRTVLVGCGNIGVGYADDSAMARHYEYSTHAQALKGHPDFDWVAAVDIDPIKVARVSLHWGVMAAESVHSIDDLTAIEVAVLAVPPGQRLPILRALPNLRAVVVEKPLGSTLREAETFVTACEQRGIVVQVNLPRRCDAALRSLASGGLIERVGQPQAATLVYGNGLLNNGTHMVDLARMLLGNVTTVSALPGFGSWREGPIEDDVNVPFVMRLESGIPVFGLPISFAHYRELAIDIWGRHGRMALTHESLNLIVWPQAPHRAMEAQREISMDIPTVELTSMGKAQKAVYDDLAEALRSGRAPASSAGSALQTAHVIDTIRRAVV
jgi:predicted dehydrogenase